MGLEIVEVRDKVELKRFILFPWEVYKNNEHWVPPLISERFHFFNREKNPFFKHADVSLFLALDNGKVVGTISAHADRNYIKFHEDNSAFYGFFECLPDYRYAEALFNTALEWAKKRGYRRLMGPFNFTTNHECGLLIDAFDSDPVLMMTYNPEYYVEYHDRYGFKKAMDLLAYYIEAKEPPQGLREAVEKVKRRANIKVRKVNMLRFFREIKIIKEIYNKAWSRNWGFTPLEDDEFDAIAKSLIPMISPSFALIAEVGGKPIGFALSLPDFNVVAKKMNGRMFPFGIFHFIFGRFKIKNLRVFTLGIIPEYQHLGAGAILYYETWMNALKKGYKWAEMSWILENNEPMNNAIIMAGGRVYKRYRIYEKEV